MRVVVSEVDKITVLEHHFRDWEFKAISRPEVLNLIEYWKEASLFYELEPKTSSIKIVSLH